MPDNTGTHEGRICSKAGMKNPQEINRSSVVLCAVLFIKKKKPKKQQIHPGNIKGRYATMTKDQDMNYRISL